MVSMATLVAGYAAGRQQVRGGSGGFGGPAEAGGAANRPFWRHVVNFLPLLFFRQGRFFGLDKHVYWLPRTLASSRSNVWGPADVCWCRAALAAFPFSSNDLEFHSGRRRCLFDLPHRCSEAGAGSRCFAVGSMLADWGRT